jgi:hypothetical protein
MREGGMIVIQRLLTLALIAASIAWAAGCSSSDNSNATAGANTNTNPEAAYTAPITAPGPDNSQITTTNENGVKTETRTFSNNPRVSKVVVTTRDGNRTVKVYSPSGEEREMKSGPEKALDATGEAIADSVGFVKDKGGNVVDKTKDTGSTVVDKTKEGTRTGIDKTKEGAETVKDTTTNTAKKVGSKTKEGADTVVDKTKSGTKKAVNAVKKVIP